MHAAEMQAGRADVWSKDAHTHARTCALFPKRQGYYNENAT